MSEEQKREPAGRHGIGGNLPPLDDLEEQKAQDRQRVELKHAILIGRAQRLVESFEAMPAEIDSEELAGKASELRKMLRQCRDDLEGERKREKRRYDDLSASIHSFFLDKAEPVLAALDKLAAREQAWLTAKARKEEERRKAEAAAAAAKEAEAKRQREELEARLAEEKAKRLAAEEKARQAAQPKPSASPPPAPIDEDALLAEADAEMALEDAQAAERLAVADRETKDQRAGVKLSKLAKTRSDRGAQTGLRQKWTYLSINRKQLPLAQLRPYFSDECLGKAVQAFIDAGGRKLKGVEIAEALATSNK